MKTLPRISNLLALALLTTGLSVSAAVEPFSADQAFAALKTYDEGQSTAPLHVIERSVGRASGDPAQRQQTAERLAAILASPQTSDVAKLFICQQLRLVGGDAQVPMLAKLLDDPKTTHPARIALQDMPGEAAGQALRDGLNRLKGDSLVGLINSLVARRETSAVVRLANLVDNTDATVRAAAQAAMARFGAKVTVVALDSGKSSSVVLDDQLAYAAEMVRNGNVSSAEPIYRKLCAAEQPLNIRMAALNGLAKAAPSAAMPLVVESLTASEPPLQNLAIELARNLPSTEAAATLNKALSKLEGQTRLLALGALAERGDRPALDTLAQLAASQDPAARAEAARELRRLRFAAKDAAVRERIAVLVADTGSSATALEAAPYPATVIVQRKAQVATGLAAGDKLVCYLDCGAESRAQDSGVTLRQLGGRAHLFPGSETAAPPTFGTIGFESGHVDFELAGLDPQKAYALGFSWWDFDGGGRAQSVHFAGSDAGKRVEALASTQLPAFSGKNQGPATGQLPIPAQLSSQGKVRVIVTRQSGPNAVASELWLIETKPGSPTATKTTISGLPVGQASSPVPPKPQADLTPFSDGTKVLLVTGDDYPGHPWRQTSPALKDLLEKDPRLKVRIVEDPEALASPKLKDWDAVIVHFMDWEKPGPGPAARENLKQFVAGGKGIMLTHFACGAWDNNEWPEFKTLAGRVWDPKLRGHDPHGKFRVEIADPEHPTMKGMEPFETIDELYTCLAGDAPIHVVAKATSKVDKKEYPMAFVLNYGQGRVFHTVLGHNALAYTNSPGVGELMRRGCAWAAGIPPTK